MLDIRHRKITKTEGTYVHITAYTPDESATIVPDAPDASESDLDTMPPKKGHHIVDYDATIKITGNHLIMCLNGIHENHIKNYLNQILNKAIQSTPNLEFDLSRKADIQKIKLIQKEGVKHIDLNVDLYHATLEHEHRKSAQNKFGYKITETLKALGLRDETRSSLEKSENLRAKLLIRVDGRGKDKSPIGYERLQDVARNLLDSQDGDDFLIITKNNKKIRSNEISLSKTVDILGDGGKAISYQQAWSEQKKYFNELLETQALEL